MNGTAARSLVALAFLLSVPLVVLAEEGTIRGEPIIKDDFETMHAQG